VKTPESVQHEARILARVAQFKREGLWSDEKVPKKLSEPAPPRTHWSYVLEEMNWLSGVIQVEIKSRKAGCRRCARMVRTYFQERAQAAVREEREHEQARRRAAAFAAKEIRTFWGNVEKLFEFRLRRQIEKKRKHALDQHLDFLVGKTEKYSSLLAESLATSGLGGGDQTGASSSLKTTPAGSDVESVSSHSHPHLGDGEYQPDELSSDDEDTIGKDEDRHEDGELDELQRDAEEPIEELLRRVHPELFEGE